jgi:hypothetical protein
MLESSITPHHNHNQKEQPDAKNKASLFVLYYKLPPFCVAFYHFVSVNNVGSPFLSNPTEAIQQSPEKRESRGIGALTAKEN